MRQQTVIGRYIVDFTSRAAGLAVEVDGDTHATQADYDATRTRFLQAQGLRVLRFTNPDIMINLEAVLQAISDAITAQRLSLSPLAGRGA
ncbi:endonuclease domain-containing protein [Sphingomonas sp. S2-65]|nr:endonuclease domain-containing protein [Sphingomonas sp. S2-65]UYY58971.1 endonuclease domain-containing protein [Sphingomonas sp. S2-65]